MKYLVSTNGNLLSIAIFFLRIMTGLILFVAGASKALGWFGGFGMKTTVQMFKSGMNISAGWAYISTYAELIGGILLIIGFMTRPVALILVINMIAATILTGFTNFFMGGAAYPCLLAVTSLAILLAGPMHYSIDALFNKERIIS